MSRWWWVLTIVLGLGGCAARSLAGDSGTTGSETTGGEATSGAATSTVTVADVTSEGESSSDSTGSASLGTVGFVEPTTTTGQDLECNPFEQECPPGQKCMPWANDGGNSWNAAKCTSLDPDPVGVGEVCTVVESAVSGIDNCDIGAMCWDVDPQTLAGVCVALCVGSEDFFCADGSRCALAGSDVPNPCLPTCDPIVQDCEAKGHDAATCIPFGNEFICIPAAAIPGEGGYGMECEFINVCDAGLFCALAETVPGCSGSQGCCSEFCDITDPDASTGCAGSLQGQECLPWFDAGEAPRHLQHVGACSLP